MLPSSISRFPFTAVLLLVIGGRRLEAKSIIVDDSDTSRITYSGTWYNNECSTCAFPLIPIRLFNGTWHYGISADRLGLFFTFNFTGTSVEARYLATTGLLWEPSTPTHPNASYSIDGNHLGTTVRNPDNQYAYVYNESLFNIEGLSNTEHTLRVDVLDSSELLLDYLVYDDGIAAASATATSTSSSLGPSTVNDASSTPSTNIGAIVGGVVAAIVLMLGAGFLWYSKYRHRESPRSRPPILDSGPISPSAYPDPWTATVQGALPSRFYGTSDTAGQVAYKYKQISRTPVSQQAVSNHKAIYDPARSGSTPPGTSRAPLGRSSSNSKVVADNEPVEAGLMSRETPTSGALPLNGHGGVQRAQGAP